MCRRKSHPALYESIVCHPVAVVTDDDPISMELDAADRRVGVIGVLHELAQGYRGATHQTLTEFLQNGGVDDESGFRHTCVGTRPPDAAPADMRLFKRCYPDGDLFDTRRAVSCCLFTRTSGEL